MHFQNKKTDASLRKTITPPRLMQLHTANQIKSNQELTTSLISLGQDSGHFLASQYSMQITMKTNVYKVLNYDNFSQEGSPTLLQIL